MHVDTLSYSRPVILISPLTCGILYTVVWIIESILNVFTCKFYLHITVVHRQMQSILSPGAEQFYHLVLPFTMGLSVCLAPKLENKFFFSVLLCLKEPLLLGYCLISWTVLDSLLFSFYIIFQCTFQCPFSLELLAKQKLFTLPQCVHFPQPSPPPPLFLLFIFPSLITLCF